MPINIHADPRGGAIIPVSDMFSGMPINYPAKPENVVFKYDFIFTKNGRWNYINSFDALDDPLILEQQVAVVDKGERWRIINPLTMQIIREGGRSQHK